MFWHFIYLETIHLKSQIYKVTNFGISNYNSILFFYRPQTKLREGYVFTPVCDSVYRGGGVSQHASQVTWQTHTLGRHPPEQTPPSRMVNERAVRILLECILVALHFPQFCLCGTSEIYSIKTRSSRLSLNQAQIVLGGKSSVNCSLKINLLSLIFQQFR